MILPVENATSGPWFIGTGQMISRWRDTYDHEDLTPDRLVVAVAILQHLNTRSGQCNPSIGCISAASGFSRTKVKDEIRHLESIGLLRRDQRPGRATQYVFAGVHDRRQTEIEREVTRSPRTTDPPGRGGVDEVVNPVALRDHPLVALRDRPIEQEKKQERYISPPIDSKSEPTGLDPATRYEVAVSKATPAQRHVIQTWKESVEAIAEYDPLDLDAHPKLTPGEIAFRLVGWVINDRKDEDRRRAKEREDRIFSRTMTGMGRTKEQMEAEDPQIAELNRSIRERREQRERQEREQRMERERMEREFLTAHPDSLVARLQAVKSRSATDRVKRFLQAAANVERPHGETIPIDGRSEASDE